MNSKITITHSKDGSKGRYEARVEGHDGVGELTYSRTSANRIVADHTGVDDSLRGTGVGKILVDRLVADARREGFTIVPLCSCVRAQSQRNPEWSDVFDS
jgi:predicted GNAT family acetyltransferase